MPKKTHQVVLGLLGIPTPQATKKPSPLALRPHQGLPLRALRFGSRISAPSIASGVLEGGIVARDPAWGPGSCLGRCWKGVWRRFERSWEASFCGLSTGPRPYIHQLYINSAFPFPGPQSTSINSRPTPPPHFPGSRSSSINLVQLSINSSSRHLLGKCSAPGPSRLSSSKALRRLSQPPWTLGSPLPLETTPGSSPGPAEMIPKGSPRGSESPGTTSNDLPLPFKKIPRSSTSLWISQNLLGVD